MCVCVCAAMSETLNGNGFISLQCDYCQSESHKRKTSYFTFWVKIEELRSTLTISQRSSSFPVHLNYYRERKKNVYSNENLIKMCFSLICHMDNSVVKYHVTVLKKMNDAVGSIKLTKTQISIKWNWIAECVHCNRPIDTFSTTKQNGD